MHKAIASPPTKATCGHTGFHNGQANCFNVKVLVFAGAGHILFFSLYSIYNYSVANSIMIIHPRMKRPEEAGVHVLVHFFPTLLALRLEFPQYFTSLGLLRI